MRQSSQFAPEQDADRAKHESRQSYLTIRQAAKRHRPSAEKSMETAKMPRGIRIARLTRLLSSAAGPIYERMRNLDYKRAKAAAPTNTSLHQSSSKEIGEIVGAFAKGSNLQRIAEKK